MSIMRNTAVVAVLAVCGALGSVLDNRLEECGSRADPSGCLAASAAAALDRAARMADIPLLPGVTLVREATDPGREGRGLASAEQLEQALDQGDPADRSSRMLDMLYSAAVRFLQSHSLRIGLPEGSAPETFQRALEEGRAKIKKKLLPILMLVGVKLVTLLPLAIGAIALMALKALVVGKLALIIAAVIAFQKFFSGGSSAIPALGKTPVFDYGSSSGSGGWSSAGSSSSGPYYRRSMDSAAAHDLAYSAQIPSVDSNSAQ